MNTAPVKKGDLLAQLLRERGMSQAEVARRAGLSRATVCRLVSSDCAGYRVTWRALALVLGVPVTTFETGHAG